MNTIQQSKLKWLFKVLDTGELVSYTALMPTYNQITNVPAFLQRHLDKIEIDLEMKHQHIAFAVKKNRLVAVGRNTYCSHAAQERYARKAQVFDKSFLHAEVSALLKSKGKCDTLYVVRMAKSGKLLLSMPCKVCQLALEMSGVENVYYS